MSTTALVVEVLVIGIQSGVALLFWFIGFLGYGVIHKPLSLLDAHGGSWRWLPLLAAIALVICYTLGVFVDRFAVILFRFVRPLVSALCPLRLREAARGWARHAVEEEELFVRALNRERSVSLFLQDYRSRLRITRATFVNTVLIWLALWTTPHLDALLPRVPVAGPFMTVVGAAFFLFWMLVWYSYQTTFEEHLCQAARIAAEHCHSPDGKR